LGSRDPPSDRRLCVNGRLIIIYRRLIVISSVGAIYMAAKYYRSSDEASDVSGMISETVPVTRPVTKKRDLGHHLVNSSSTCTARLVY